MKGMRFAPKKFIASTSEKYEEMMKEIIYQSDVVLIVLDSRMPWISRNKRIEELLKENQRKFIYVLNKVDIAPKKIVLSAKKKLSKIGPVVEVSAANGKGIDYLRSKIYALFDSIEDCRNKVGLLGYPNMGKSSLINRLARKRSAKVSGEAGFTKGIHWIRGSKMELVDGPGFIETKDKLEQLKLGFIGAKSPEKLDDPETVAYGIIEKVLDKDKKNLEQAYKIKIRNEEIQEIIELIGKRYGHLKRGGALETKKTAMMIIRDWQSGKLRI